MSAQNVEIMAPAGSYESLMAAFNAGANSIYFGVEQLNMRARSASNFTLEDLENITALCRIKDVKAYLTLNTVLYDHDLALMRSIVDAAQKSGVNAVIACDQAVLNYCKKTGVPIHISTQANITNIEAIEFYAHFADVMVLSRECSLMQVAAITREIKRRNIIGPSGSLVQIEIFVHGSLCMAISGKCYLSLHTHNASANRGSCIQNCRKPYIVTDDEGNEFEIDNEYIMSAKDLCTINFLDKIIEAGVDILKIEGRGRSADYVQVTTKCYKEALFAYQNKTYTPEKTAEWKRQLATVFNRGFWDGYYLGREIGEWANTYGSVATQKKIYIGNTKRYYPNHCCPVKVNKKEKEAIKMASQFKS